MSKDRITKWKETKPRRHKHLKLSVLHPLLSLKKVKTQHTTNWAMPCQEWHSSFWPISTKHENRLSKRRVVFDVLLTAASRVTLPSWIFVRCHISILFNKMKTKIMADITPSQNVKKKYLRIMFQIQLIPNSDWLLPQHFWFIIQQLPQLIVCYHDVFQLIISCTDLRIRPNGNTLSCNTITVLKISYIPRNRTLTYRVHWYTITGFKDCQKIYL